MKVNTNPQRCMASQCDFCRQGCASYITFDLDSYDSRGKNRILLAIQSGRLDMQDLVDVAFKCTACGQCSEVCITGDGIYRDIQELRGEIVKEGMVPKPLVDLSKKIEKTGTAFNSKDTSWIGKDAAKTGTGYYPGCGIMAFNTGQARTTIALLDSFGMKVQPVTDMCCSSPLFRAGLVDDSKRIAGELHTHLKKNKIKTLVCSCPGCALTFKEVYPLLVKNWNIKILHVSEIIAKKIKRIESTRKPKKVMYHDPCHLARGLDMTLEPRRILSAAGHDIIEFDRSGRESVCCGFGGGMALLHPEEARRPAQLKVEEARTSGAAVIASFCPLCQRALSEASRGKIPVLDVVELL
jgi:Fe-S oxidoreductase